MARELPQEVKEILEGYLEINEDNKTIKITKENLDRNLYVKIDTIFQSMKGKWSRKDKAHVFKVSGSISELISEMLGNESMPEKNPLNFFPTPLALVSEMIDFSEIDKNECFEILEPSAGEGHISKVLREELFCSSLTVCELDRERAEHLKEEGFEVVEGDFLQYDNTKRYDYIFMNPPFNVKGDSRAYQTHILKAYELLSNKGVLVAIAPTGFISNSIKKDKVFLDFIKSNGTFKLNPEKSFKEMKTMVSTAMIRLVK